MLKHAMFTAAFTAAVLAPISAPAAGPIRVMLLDGESGGPYHKWQLTTPVLKKELEETGMFQVDVVTAPPSKGGDLSSFHPEFGKYQVVAALENASAAAIIDKRIRNRARACLRRE